MSTTAIPADAAEARIDEMIAEGLRITREAIERYKPVAIVAAYSGGDDSIVSTHFAMTNLPGVFAFNADTLVGLAPAREHIARTCGRFGWELEVGKASPTGPPKYMLVPNPNRPGKKRRVPFDPKRLVAGCWTDGETSYEEAVLNFGFPGRNKASHAIMYRKLKERSVERVCRRCCREPSDAVIFLAGIRHDESANRAGYREATRRVGSQVWVNPFYWRTAADFAAYRDEFGLPSNPVKRRCGISGECCCGTFAGGPEANAAAERDAYRAADPAFADYLEALESRVKANGYPWGWGESPPAWWKDARRGQGFLFDAFGDDGASPTFQPMCVGCTRGRR